MHEIATLSWRRFNVLIRSLSQASATVTRLNSSHYIGGGKEKVNTVAGPKAADAAFNMLFKTPAKGKRKAKK